MYAMYTPKLWNHTKKWDKKCIAINDSFQKKTSFSKWQIYYLDEQQTKAAATKVAAVYSEIL